MNLKQINILIALALFLCFDLMALYLYQTINQQLQLSTQTSQELISSYSVKLNTTGLEKLAQMIRPKSGSAKTKLPEMAMIAPIKAGSVTIRLLNGNGIEGHAQAMSAVLKQGGYDVTEVINADRDDYEQTIIKYDEKNQSIVLDLQKQLQSFYNEIELNQQVDWGNKIEIVLGKPAQIVEGGENTSE